MELGKILIVFIVMSMVSGMGILLLFLMKNPYVKKGIFYFLAAWGMIIAVLDVKSLPASQVSSQLMAWGFGFLSAAGLIIHIRGRSKHSFQIACMLVAASIILGTLKLFRLF